MAAKKEEKRTWRQYLTSTWSTTYETTVKYGTPALRAAGDGAWLLFAVGGLLVVPVLIEMQREAMLAVEKEQQTSQVEELQRQLSAIRQEGSIGATIGALASAISGNADSAADGAAAAAGAPSDAPSSS